MPQNTLKSRKWWNLLKYNINIRPDYDNRSISGSNLVQFKVIQTDSIMQIDLQEPMVISDILWKDHSLKFHRLGNHYLIYFPHALQSNSTESIQLFFNGHPKMALRPPWDNGWIWSSDKYGRPWMSVACEGSGASIWLPCKEVAYDEPDSGISIQIRVPDTLVAVSNGRLVSIKHHKDGSSTFSWKVSSPINSYDIIPYIGKYSTWHSDYDGIKGNLDCDFWVLDYNLNKAQRHFKQVDTMLRCFEYWLGPYPFYSDSYKLVEAPMVGMEHQSAIAYGNGFENSYLGRDLSKSGWGMKWDFILVHESGHEWFGNSITASNEGESWIHEGFTKYLETLYTSYVYGIEAGNDYATGIFNRILNDTPIIGSNSSDQYNKSSAMLHDIRQIIGDSAFRLMLNGLSKAFYHQTVSSEQLFHFINQSTKRDFTPLFRQYLMSTQVPVLEYSFQEDSFSYRWSNCVMGFNMPVKISFGNKKPFFIYPAEFWKKFPLQGAFTNNLTVDRNFYIKTKKTNSKVQ